MENRNEFGIEDLKKMFPQIPRKDEMEDVWYKQMLKILIEGFLDWINSGTVLYRFNGWNIHVLGTLLTVKIFVDSDSEMRLEKIFFHSRMSRTSPDKDPSSEINFLFRDYVRKSDPAKLMLLLENHTEEILFPDDQQPLGSA